MWSKKHTSPKSCSECHAKLPPQAEACSECGYPVTGTYAQDDKERPGAAMQEYKLIQLLGVSVFSVGIIAALAESPIAASVAISIGCATYLTGLLGSWWNSGD